MQQIFIARHGQSMANAQQIIAGQQESDLSELGKRQVQQLAEAAMNYHVDMIVSSPMKRALHSAEIIAEHIGYSLDDIHVIPELIERQLGKLEGKQYRDTPYGNGNTVAAEDVPDIEPIDAFYERVKHALEAMHELHGKHILVVCHNGTGRMLRTVYSGGKPIEMYDQPRLENAAILPLDDSYLS